MQGVRRATIKRTVRRMSLWHDHECLGRRYGNAQQALDDLCGGHCDWPGTTDPSTLGLPDEVGDWTPLAPQRR